MRQTIHHRTLSLIVESINIGAFLDKEVDQASAVLTVNVEYSQPITVGNVADATMARKQIDNSIFLARVDSCCFTLHILFCSINDVHTFAPANLHTRMLRVEMGHSREEARSV